jgi:cephalosporin-C deacetylase
MTSGILDRHSYYYRRLYIDTIRLLQALLTLDRVDPDRLVLTGASQGGGLALAAAGLAQWAGLPLAGVMPDVAFLCDFPRAVGLTEAYPYQEIADYLRYNPQHTARVFDTLAYFDAVNFARRLTIPALFSVALMDQVCPPSTVYAAYNSYAGPDKTLRVWPYNDHEGGQDHMIAEQLAWLAPRIGHDLPQGPPVHP